jgi:hypothetical protein
LVGARVLGQSFSFFGNASKTDEKNTRKKKEETSNEAKVKKEKSIAQGSEADATESAAVASSQEQGGAQPLPPLASVKDHWLSMRFRTNWLWWVVGGYFASCWVFNCADVLNQFILPDEIFTEAAESVRNVKKHTSSLSPLQHVSEMPYVITVDVTCMKVVSSCLFNFLFRWSPR